MVDHDPETLRRRADNCERIALRMTDAKTVTALTRLAQYYLNQADEADAAQHAVGSVNQIS